MEQKIILIHDEETYDCEKYLEEGWTIKQISAAFSTEIMGPMGGKYQDASPACYVLLEKLK